MRKVMVPVLVVLLCLGGCASRADPTPYLEELTRVLTVHDDLSAAYCRALEAALDYGQDPQGEGLDEAKAACIQALSAAADLETVEPALTEDQLAAMADLGMNEADYLTPFRTQAYERAVRMQTLTDVLACLNRGPEGRETAALLAEQELAFEQWDRQIRYLGINDLLAELPEETVRAYREEVLAGLASYQEGLPPWEDSREAVALRSEEVLAEMDAWLAGAAAETGELYAALLAQANDPEEEMTAAGAAPEAAAAVEQRFAQLREESGS